LFLLLKRNRAEFKKFAHIKECPVAAITLIYLYTPIAQVVEDYGFIKMKIREHRRGKKARNKARNVTWKTKNMIKEGERFYFPIDWVVQLS
jgi:hypothetical protein